MQHALPPLLREKPAELAARIACSTPSEMERRLARCHCQRELDGPTTLAHRTTRLASAAAPRAGLPCLSILVFENR